LTAPPDPKTLNCFYDREIARIDGVRAAAGRAGRSGCLSDVPAQYLCRLELRQKQEG